MSKEEKDIGKIMEEMLNRPLELIEENKKLKKKIEKLQKENEELKTENRILSVKLAEYFSDNNLCEKGCKYCESEKDKEKIE